jgi:hypothetical protein
VTRPKPKKATVRYECCSHCQIAGKCGDYGMHPFPCEVPGCAAGGTVKKERRK